MTKVTNSLPNSEHAANRPRMEMPFFGWPTQNSFGVHPNSRLPAAVPEHEVETAKNARLVSKFLEGIAGFEYARIGQAAASSQQSS